MFKPIRMSVMHQSRHPCAKSRLTSQKLILRVVDVRGRGRNILMALVVCEEAPVGVQLYTSCKVILRQSDV